METLGSLSHYLCNQLAWPNPSRIGALLLSPRTPQSGYVEATTHRGIRAESQEQLLSLFWVSDAQQKRDEATNVNHMYLTFLRSQINKCPKKELKWTLIIHVL